jgi:molybdopterin/thiamine biosynthesis adenylyltransferase
MIDTTVLEAWCFYAEKETDGDELAESKREMAADIMAVLAELRAARLVVEAVNKAKAEHYYNTYSLVYKAVADYDKATQPNPEPSQIKIWTE